MHKLLLNRGKYHIISTVSVWYHIVWYLAISNLNYIYMYMWRPTWRCTLCWSVLFRSRLIDCSTDTLIPETFNIVIVTSESSHLKRTQTDTQTKRQTQEQLFRSRLIDCSTDTLIPETFNIVIVTSESSHLKRTQTDTQTKRQTQEQCQHGMIRPSILKTNIIFSGIHLNGL
jgi:regulator of extracellular matrix RemA (YlzA/DUF370 family)